MPTPPAPDTYIVFLLDARRYALPLAAAQRIVRAVAVTPLPGGPESLIGVVNVQGRIIPIADLRRALGHPAHPIRLSDQLLITQVRGGPLGVIVDAVTGLLTGAVVDLGAAGAAGPPGRGVRGVIKHPDGLVIVLDDLAAICEVDHPALQATLAALDTSPV